MDKRRKISFPSFEIDNIKKSLDETNHISTHRIMKEYDKYKLEKIYYHPKLGFLQVMAVMKMIDINYSPAYSCMKNWTKEQQKQLKNANKIEYIKLKRVYK